MSDKLFTSQNVLANAPFGNQFTIESIHPLQNSGSGRAFKVLDQNQKPFKLRICNSETDAIKLESKIHKLKNVFPRLIAIDRQYLLLEFVAGKKITSAQFMRAPNGNQHLTKFWYQVGKLQGLTHCHPDTGNQDEIDQFLFSTLETVTANKHLSKKEHSRIAHQYQSLRQKYDYKFCIDLRDTYLPNFLATPSRLYYLDEGGLSHIKGMGLSACFRQLSWQFKHHLNHCAQSLLAGYAQTAPAPLDPNYLTMVGFYEQIRRIASRMKKKEPIHLDIARLQTFQQI